MGIITKATLKLVPLPPYKLDVLAVFTDLAKATALVPKLIKAGLNPTSVEFMDNNFVRSASDYSDLNCLTTKMAVMISFPSKPSTKTNWTIKWKIGRCL